MKFALEHEILARQDRLEAAIARHNALSAMIPRELTAELIADLQMVLAEAEANMKDIVALLAEQEAAVQRSELFRAGISK